MKTLSEIADKLEAQPDFGQRRELLGLHEAEIINVLDGMAWDQQVRPLMKVHVLRWFRDIDYDVDPRLADMMAHMVRSLYPAEPGDEPALFE